MCPVKWTRHFTKIEESRQLDYFDNKWEYSSSGGKYLYSTPDVDLGKLSEFNPDFEIPEKVFSKDEELAEVEVKFVVNFKHFVRVNLYRDKYRLYNKMGKYWNEKISYYEIDSTPVELLPPSIVSDITSHNGYSYDDPYYEIDSIKEKGVPKEGIELIRENQSRYIVEIERKLASMRNREAEDEFYFQLALKSAGTSTLEQNGGYCLKDSPIIKEIPIAKKAENPKMSYGESNLESPLMAQLKKAGLA